MFRRNRRGQMSAPNPPTVPTSSGVPKPPPPNYPVPAPGRWRHSGDAGTPAVERSGIEQYPMTVVVARYGGLYEGGSWVAFPFDPWDIPQDAFGGDVDCMIWWRENGDSVGTGPTPNDAVADYHERVLGLVQCPIAAQAGIQRYVEAR